MTAIPYTIDAFATPEASSLKKAHEDDAGFDLRASDQSWLEPGDLALVPTGIRIALPYGWCGLILPRSGLASKEGLTIPNAPGLIDAGYRGEIKVPLYLLPTRDDIYTIAQGRESRLFQIKAGDRIAQLIVVEVAAAAHYFPPEKFQTMWGETERGESGFGSSGR